MTRALRLKNLDAADIRTEAPMLFDPERIGRSLKEVAVDVIETEGAPILSRWFHSSRDVELFIWIDGDKNVIKHQITFFGQVVEWNVFEGVKTGVVVEEESEINHGEENVSETIQFDHVLDAHAVSSAMRLVEFVTDLAAGDRLKIRENLRSRVKASPESSDPFIRRYGEVYGREVSRPTSFFKRLRRWFGSGT